MCGYAENYSFEGKNPFYVVPWHEDFLRHTEKLVQDFVTAKGISMQDIVLVFPNDRPRLYLTSRCRETAKKNKKAMILPGIYTATEFYSLCLQHFERGLPFFSEMAPLDRYAVLYRIVREVLEEKEFSHFSQSMETDGREELQMAKFYPWAVSLDRLFEECFRHLILPQNIEYADAEVSKFARSLLAELEEIFARYTEELRENGFTTPGFSLFRAAKYVQAFTGYRQDGEADFSLLPLADSCADSGFSEKYFADFMPGLLRGKCIVFAGFVQLTKAEETLMRHFWEQGACISLYTDPLVCTDPENAHYSCADHVRWIRGWQADTFSAAGALRKKEAEITFLPAYDLHSQLQVFAKDIQKDIADAPQEDDFCAVVLPSPSLLLPVLHELPNKNVNISLGYPVRRTLLWQFTEIIFRLQQNRKDGRLYLVADLLTLLHHPYTRMLLGLSEEETSDAEEAKNNFKTWRSVLFYAEKKLGTAGVWVDFDEFVTNELFNLDEKKLPYELNEEMEVFVSEFFEKTVFAWEDTETLGDVGVNLNNLLDFLIVRGADVWKRFPLDTEGLGRFLQNTVPAVMQNSLASEVLPLSSLFGILEQLAAEERVPFEADPLIGLQVLGMLETRLLRFRKVYVLDCTESSLPGISSQDPLMPDSLRNIFGLPDRQSRDMIIAHTFYRLINSAEEVHCYWQEGVQSSEIQSSKNIRSRFAEELIWKKQKELHKRYRGKLSKEQEKEMILRSVKCEPKAPARREKRSVVIGPKVKSALENLAKSGFSAMALNTFLQCPVSFYFSYLAGIYEQTLQEPGNNRQIFGIKLHEVLKNMYEANPRMKHSEKNFAVLMEKFSETFNKDNWRECLAPDSYFMLKESGKFFLKKYWDSCGEDTEVLTVEHEFSHTLNHELFSSPVLFKGKTDRVDKRGDVYCIVDYKTTKNTKKASKLWKNTAFLDELALFCQNWDSGKSRLYFEKLAEQLPDIQLPFYLYLFAKDYARSGNVVDEKTKINASWIFLSERKGNMEVFLVDEKYAKGGDMWEMLYEIREKRVETVLDFLLNFMAREKEWKCKEGKYCSYCPYAEYC